MNEIDFIRGSLREMQVHYDNGDYESACAAARTAYLGSHEYVETPLRPIDPDFTLEVEYQFADLRNLIKEWATYEEVREVSVAIERSLDESERLVTGTGQIAPFIAFSASFARIFREGLEAVLILGAILMYMIPSRNTRLKPYVYYSVIAGIGATGVTWLVASYIIEISGANRELEDGDYAFANTESAKIALKKLGQRLGVSYFEAAQSIIQTASIDITKTISQIMKDYKMDSSIGIIGDGGGASVLVPFVAK